MSVVDRLKRLTGEDDDALARERERQEREKKLADLRRRIETVLQRRPGEAGAPAVTPATTDPHYAPLGLDAVASGREYDTPHGKVFVAEGNLDAGEFWGRRRLREFGAVEMNAAALLARDETLRDFAPSGALFLDTETTGLSGGTGTLAFLIGVGWLEDDRFVTRLIFARDFTEEAAALWTLSQLAAARSFLVTFNGRTFDVPLLAARFVLNRLDDPLSTLPHLDLLPPSRRLLGHRLENSRLVTLEAEVLGVQRTGDIPGSEIPERYFAYLRSRDARLVADILEHNRLDVVSMAALLTHLAELVCRGHETADAEGADVVQAARLHLHRGSATDAEALLRDLLAAGAGQAHHDATSELSLICKRAERLTEAVALWRGLLAGKPDDVFASTEMAKWLEHREKRFAEAIGVVQRALAGPDADEPTREALAYRLARLRRKHDRHEA